MAIDIMSNKKLKAAFVGGAYDSAVGRSHRIAIEMDQCFELVAGCFSRDKKRNHTSANKYGVGLDRVYSGLDDLLKHEINNIDCIILLTPQDQHFEHVMACLRTGIPVICEKALVCSCAEAIQIRELLKSSGGYLAVTYNYTGYPMIRELKHMINVGLLGKIQQIHMEMPQEGFARLSPEGFPISPQEWRLRDGSIPTISLDLGVHLHMMVKFLADESPEEVVAITANRGNFSKIVDNVNCFVKYTNDIDCSIWYSKTALGYRNGLKIRIFGDQGTAEWVQEDPEFLYYSDNSGGKCCLDRTSKNIKVANQVRYQRFKAGHPAGFIEAFANYYVDIADSLQRDLQNDTASENQYVFGIEESLEGLNLLEAISRSSKSKKWEIIK